MGKYCRYCGNELEGDEKYCSNCGEKILTDAFDYNYEKGSLSSDNSKTAAPLKGTVLVQITVIIQVILNIIVLVILPELGVFFILDTALLIIAYFGFKSGKRGWAIFALI